MSGRACCSSIADTPGLARTSSAREAPKAERQREADELLHRGAAAFEQGQPVAARRLLTAAIERGAAPDVPLAYLGRLDRLGAPAAVTPEPSPPRSGRG